MACVVSRFSRLRYEYDTLSVHRLQSAVSDWNDYWNKMIIPWRFHCFSLNRAEIRRRCVKYSQTNTVFDVFQKANAHTYGNDSANEYILQIYTPNHTIFVRFSIYTRKQQSNLQCGIINNIQKSASYDFLHTSEYFFPLGTKLVETVSFFRTIYTPARRVQYIKNKRQKNPRWTNVVSVRKRNRKIRLKLSGVFIRLR